MSPKIGVFTQQDLISAVNARRLIPLKGFDEKHVSPASVDITITGEDMYMLSHLFKPSHQKNERVMDVIKPFVIRKITVGEVMYPGHQYIAKASVDANFPPGMYAYANAKSTSGRNFLLVRTLADGIGQFDAIDKRYQGYTGNIYLVFQPLSYPIILSDKECYAQLRLFNGDTRFDDSDLREILLEHNLLLRRDGSDYNQGELSLFSNDGSIFCTLYAKPGECVGYKAKSNAKALNLESRSGDLDQFFEKVYSKSCAINDIDSGYVELKAGEHYLLSTNEVLNVPDGLCAELRALDPRLGIFLSHFAGFCDPGFRGNITLEVTAPYDMVLRHGDPVARLVFEKLRGTTISYGKAGNYQGQIGARLPKQFRSFE